MSSEPLAVLVRRAREAEREGNWDDALAQYESALELVPRHGNPADAADILRWIGSVHSGRGDVELALEVYEVSLHIAEAGGYAKQLAAGLVCLAVLDQLTGRLESADELYRRAWSIADGLGDIHLAAMVEQNLGTLANIRGEVHLALEHYERVLQHSRGLGDAHASAGALTNIGMARLDLQQWEQAEDAFEEALALAEHLRDAALMGDVQINRGELFFRQRRFGAARECGDRAFEIFGRLGSDSGLAEVYKLFGMVCRESSRSHQSNAHLASAVRLAQQCQDRLLEAEALSEWALVHLVEERNREALHALNRAHQLFQDLSARRELLDLDRRLDKLESTYLQVVAAWGESIEGKDRYTAGHCERVANYACMLAEAVGITGRDLTWLRMGGYLHDVGKISVPDEVLNKPDKLTDEEFALIQGHAAEGDAIVAELNFPWDIRPAVRWHHERWDGSGYPDGLKGEMIPLTARILCLADVYDALTTTRSYRPALAIDEALGIMERDVGRFFDPELFPTFKALILKSAPSGDRRFPAFGRKDVIAA